MLFILIIVGAKRKKEIQALIVDLFEFKMGWYLGDISFKDILFVKLSRA